MKQCFHEETVLFYVHCWQESSTHRLSIVVVGYTGRGKKSHFRRAADCNRFLREAVFLSLETLERENVPISLKGNPVSEV